MSEEKSIENMTEQELIEAMNGKNSVNDCTIIDLGIDKNARSQESLSDKKQEDWTEEDWARYMDEDGRNNQVFNL